MYIHTCILVCMCICVEIYIYRERDRESERAQLSDVQIYLRPSGQSASYMRTWNLWKNHSDRVPTSFPNGLSVSRQGSELSFSS